MIVVSDAGPLRYLAVLHLADLLSHYFERVLIPPAVAQDLLHQNTPAPVRLLVASPPPWLERAEVRQPLVQSKALGRGEREAITLALERGGLLLLCDDAGARAFAERSGLRVVGTLGILKSAALDDRIDLAGAIEKLKTATNFRGTDELYRRVLQEFESEVRRSREQN
jgi:uncharacterized protein